MDRPWVVVNMAMTVDGKISSSRREGLRLASAIDRRRMDELRAQADALMIGAGTLRAANPSLHIRDPALQALRQAQGKTAPLLKIVVSASLTLDRHARFFGYPWEEKIIATPCNAPAERLAQLSAHANLWKMGHDQVPMNALLKRLWDQGVQRVVVEGGGALHWQLIQAGGVDEIYVTLAPALLGGRTAPTLLDGEGWGVLERCPLTLLDVHTEGNEVFCHYQVRGANR